jgi:cell envelope opacity-associated protein A
MQSTYQNDINTIKMNYKCQSQQPALAAAVFVHPTLLVNNYHYPSIVAEKLDEDHHRSMVNQIPSISCDIFAF